MAYLVPYSFHHCSLPGFLVIAFPYQLLQVRILHITVTISRAFLQHHHVFLFHIVPFNTHRSILFYVVHTVPKQCHGFTESHMVPYSCLVFYMVHGTSTASNHSVQSQLTSSHMVHGTSIPHLIILPSRIIIHNSYFILHRWFDEARTVPPVSECSVSKVPLWGPTHIKKKKKIQT